MKSKSENFHERDSAASSLQHFAAVDHHPLLTLKANWYTGHLLGTHKNFPKTVIGNSEPIYTMLQWHP